MKNKIFSISLIFFFLIIFLVFYKGLQNSNIYTPDLEIKKNIPTFKAQIFDTSNEISSKKIFNNDQYYLLNIWSSWCVPCRDEHPFLVYLSSKKNLKIIGLNYKDNNKSAKTFLKELNNPYELIFSDRDGIIAIEWGAYGVPESFLIYKKKIIKKIIGPLNKEILFEIEEIIK